MKILTLLNCTIKLREFPGGLVGKDSTLSLLWLAFDPWPRNVSMLWAWPKKKKMIKMVNSMFCVFSTIYKKKKKGISGFHTRPSIQGFPRDVGKLLMVSRSHVSMSGS